MLSNGLSRAQCYRRGADVTPEIGKALTNGASAEEIRAIALSQGMTPIASDGLRRVANGETTLEELMWVLG